MIKKITLLIFAFSILLWCNPWEASAVDIKNKPVGKVVMVIVDHISWEELTKNNLRVFSDIIPKGSTGLMTTNPAGGNLRIPQNTYITIGAGTKLSGGQAAGQGLNTSEAYENDISGKAYYRRMGLEPKGEIVNLGIAQVDRINKDLKYEFLPGAIGTILHSQGLKTAVLGNADLPVSFDKERYRRYAVNIAMDRYGQVDYGTVGSECNISDPEIPGGIRTNFDYLLKEFQRLKEKTDFIVIETGDTSRLERQSEIISANNLERQKRKALQRIDDFLGDVLSRINLETDLLMVVVPGPSTLAMNNGDFQTPIIMLGKNVGGGVVWSGTTKRNGLISNTDIAATVVGHFGLEPKAFISDQKKEILLNGQIIESVPSVDTFAEIDLLGSKTTFIHNARYPFVKAYINLSLAVLGLAFLSMKMDLKTGNFLRPVLLGVTFMPPIYLTASYFTNLTLLAAGLITFFLIAGFTYLSQLAGKKYSFSPFVLSSGMTMSLLIFDMFNGGGLSQNSPLSYDVAAGARFYGIGNEYMGIFIGSTITFAALLIDRFVNMPALMRKVGTMLLFALVIYTISAPHLGTNAGGALAAIAGLGTAGLIVYGGRIEWKTVLPVSACAVIILGAFVFFDATRAVETQSHMGRTIGLIRENGVTEIVNIVTRKLAVNLKLIKSTTWSWFFFSSLFIMLFRHKLFSPIAERYDKENLWFTRLIPGILVGSLAALAFNDSGVVAAATLMSYSTPPMMWELLKLKESETL